MRKLSLFAVLAVTCTGYIVAGPIFDFDPTGGDLSGAPGSTVGWGLSVTDADQFVIISQTAFCTSAAQESDLSNCDAQVASLGAYTDFSGPNFFVVGPSPEMQNLTQTFDPLAPTGYGSFAIGSGVAPGTVGTGVIAIIYQLYDDDPLNGGAQVGGDNFIALPASVTVPGAVTVGAVPEPATLWPAGLLLTAFILFRTKFRRVWRA
jgi:hypothetical protein